MRAESCVKDSDLQVLADNGEKRGRSHASLSLAYPIYSLYPSYNVGAGGGRFPKSSRLVHEL